MHVEVREYLERKSNGDRASRLSPSSRFEIFLVGAVNESELVEMNIATFDCYDNFYVSVRARIMVLKEVNNYVEELTFKFGLLSRYKRFKGEPTQTVVWKEIKE